MPSADWRERPEPVPPVPPGPWVPPDPPWPPVGAVVTRMVSFAWVGSDEISLGPPEFPVAPAPAPSPPPPGRRYSVEGRTRAGTARRRRWLAAPAPPP